MTRLFSLWRGRTRYCGHQTPNHICCTRRSAYAQGGVSLLTAEGGRISVGFVKITRPQSVQLFVSSNILLDIVSTAECEFLYKLNCAKWMEIILIHNLLRRWGFLVHFLCNMLSLDQIMAFNFICYQRQENILSLSTFNQVARHRIL